MFKQPVIDQCKTFARYFSKVFEEQGAMTELADVSVCVFMESVYV